MRRGPFPVERLAVQRWCVAGGRCVAATLHHPASPAGPPAPAVVFCHGLGSGRDEYAALGSHLASHGIVSIHPEFDDAFALMRERLGRPDLDSTTWSAEPGARGAMLRLLFDPARWRSRAHCARAAIDAIDSHPVPGLTGGPVVIAGHSFGAFTAQMLAGVRLFEPSLSGEEFAHPAVAGAALLSPQGSGSRGLRPGSWADLRLPLLVVTATHDLGPNGEGLAWRREPFDAAPARDKWLVVARGRDHGLGGIARPGTGGHRDVVAGIAGTVAAFTAAVGGDARAGAWLDSGVRPDLFEHLSRAEVP
jgi:dienelactone hydrolase